MTPPPPNPRVYHITHVGNLPAIIARGWLLSDAAMIASGGPAVAIGMGTIKSRRLALPVRCHQGLRVGDCVPFYFCPRSVMLYLLYQGNHPDLTYRSGQGPIVHLEADLNAVVQWANAASPARRWAFSLSNAGAGYVQFRNSLAQLGDVDWFSVCSNSFGSGAQSPTGLAVKEGKQAEFLLEQAFPWHLVRKVGVHSQAVATQVHTALAGAAHTPQVSVEPSWYF